MEKASVRSEKQKRLEKALRENLLKRKIQQREREDKEKATNTSELENPDQGKVQSKPERDGISR